VEKGEEKRRGYAVIRESEMRGVESTFNRNEGENKETVSASCFDIK